jgi:hypothetical protein
MSKTLSRILLALALSLGLSLTAQADTRRIYPNTSHADPDGGGALSSVTTSLVDLVRFLMDDCDGATYDCVAGAATSGPGWTAVRAHSNGANYEDVGTPTDLDSLATCVAWEGDGTALAAGDWIVLESATSTGGGGNNHFQLYIEYESTTVINFLMLPMEDWSTSSASPPVWTAGNACGVAACKGVGAGANTLVAFTTTSTTTSMLAVADEDVLILLRDNSAAPDIIYVGGVDNNLSTSTPPDDRPFIIYDTPASVFLDTSQLWNRLAPDDATTLVLGGPAIPTVFGGVALDEFPGLYNGAYQIVGVLIYFSDASHAHITGTLQYVRTGSDEIGTAARTINGAAWACRGSNAANSPWCLSWDGVEYP